MITAIEAGDAIVMIVGLIIVLMGLVMLRLNRSDTRGLERLQEIIDKGMPMATLSMKTRCLKYGWKAIVYKDGKSVFTTTRYYDTEKEAIDIVRDLFCKPWDFTND